MSRPVRPKNVKTRGYDFQVGHYTPPATPSPLAARRMSDEWNYANSLLLNPENLNGIKKLQELAAGGQATTK